MTKRRIRQYHTCNRGSKCNNPNQGSLTKADYERYGSGVYRKVCKVCMAANFLGRTTCARKHNCVSARQGDLTPQDFSSGNRVCVYCMGEASLLDVVRSSIQQQYLSGAIGPLANRQDTRRTLYGY